MRAWVVVVGVLVVGGVAAYWQFRGSDLPKEHPAPPVQTARVEPVIAAVPAKADPVPPPAPPKTVTPPAEPERIPSKLDIPQLEIPPISPPALPVTPPVATPVVPPPTPPVIPPVEPKLPESLVLSGPAVPAPAPTPAVPPGLPAAPPKIELPEPDPVPPPILPVAGENATKPVPPNPPGAGALPPLADFGQPTAPKLDVPTPPKSDPVADLPSSPTATPPPAPKFLPFVSVPEGAAAAAVNVPRVRVKYEVTKAGPSGVGTVELWLKDKNGWARAAGVKSGDPLEAELPLDGAYGVKVVPVSGQGVRGPEPAADGAPDVWIVRDTVKPAASLKVTPAPMKDGKPPAAPFVVEVVVRDANLEVAKLGFAWRDADPAGKPREGSPLFTGADLTKPRIETKIGTFERRKTAPDEPGLLTAVFDWTPAADVPAKVALEVEALDRAGNKSAAGAEFGTDLTQPAAKVVGVQVVPGK